MRLIINSFFILIICTVQSQEMSSADENKENPNISRFYMINDIWTQKNGVPLLSENKTFSNDEDLLLKSKWNTELTVYPKAGNIVEFSNTNYNILDDEFMVQTKKGSIFRLENSTIDSVKYNNVIYKSINEKGNFAILHSGKVSFLKKYVVNRSKSRRDPLSHSEIISSEYKKKIEYYLYVEETLNPIKLNKSKILNFLSDKKDDLESFMKSHNLSFSKEQDVIKLIKYYNAIK